jgi:hypothetical protein
MDLFKRKPSQDIVPSKEMELLLHCSRTRIDETTATHIRELANGEIDWPSLRALAHRHRVMPLLYRSLYKTCSELVPEDALGYLRQDYQANAARNLILTGELLKVLDAMESAGIPAIAYKGYVLAQTAYGDIALRQFNDLDVLIQEENLWRARDELAPLGFEPVPPYDRFERGNYHRGDGEFKLRHREREITLEIHWLPVTRSFTFEPDLEDLFQRAQEIELEGWGIRRIPPETMLLVLCVHGTHDGWPRINFICDIAEYIHSEPEMDWERTFNLAHQFGSQRMLRIGMLLASDVIGVTFSEPMLQFIHSDPTASSLARKISRKLILSDSQNASLNLRWLEIQARERNQDKLRFGVELLLKPSVEDWSLMRLPSWLGFLYIPLRYLRVMIKNSSLTSVRRNPAAREVERTHAPDIQ